jgi:hypothetical protein
VFSVSLSGSLESSVAILTVTEMCQILSLILPSASRRRLMPDFLVPFENWGPLDGPTIGGRAFLVVKLPTQGLEFQVQRLEVHCLFAHDHSYGIRGLWGVGSPS